MFLRALFMLLILTRPVQAQLCVNVIAALPSDATPGLLDFFALGGLGPVLEVSGSEQTDGFVIGVDRVPSEAGGRFGIFLDPEARKEIEAMMLAGVEIFLLSGKPGYQGVVANTRLEPWKSIRSTIGRNLPDRAAIAFSAHADISAVYHERQHVYLLANSDKGFLGSLEQIRPHLTEGEFNAWYEFSQEYIAGCVELDAVAADTRPTIPAYLAPSSLAKFPHVTEEYRKAGIAHYAEARQLYENEYRQNQKPDGTSEVSTGALLRMRAGEVELILRNAGSRAYKMYVQIKARDFLLAQTIVDAVYRMEESVKDASTKVKINAHPFIHP